MKKYKSLPYNFKLQTISLLEERGMQSDHLYEGWRDFPKKLMILKDDYLKKPTKLKLNSLIKRDTMFYYGVLEMIDDRIKRVTNLKSETLIINNLSKLGFFIVSEFNKSPQGLPITSIRGYYRDDIMYERDKIIYLQNEFVRTGKVKIITQLRKKDKELYNEVKVILKKLKK